MPNTILLVEDELLIRHVIADYLRDCGFKVYEAASADEAISLLMSPEVSVELVFSDVQMPGSMDGFGLARWVRTNRPGVGVILASGPERATQLAGELCEAGPVLAKPYDPQIALDHIKQLIRKGERGSEDQPRARRPIRLAMKTAPHIPWARRSPAIPVIQLSDLTS
jgi:DNA-binding response OmpR family regulator